MSSEAIDLLFGGLPQLGPGSDEQTLATLRCVPPGERRRIVDVGCGSGRQTLALVRELGVAVEAIDLHQPFLDELVAKAAAAGLEDLVRVHALDMAQLGEHFAEIDLLWCEGAAYSIGFENALHRWRPALARGGILVVSELSWLRDDPPAATREFFETGYPEMRDVEACATIARSAGYEVLESRVLPRRCWTEGFYELLKPRASALLEHADEDVRQFAAEMLREIEVFESDDGSYGYTVFVLR